MIPKCILFSEPLSMGLYILILKVQTHLSSRCWGSQRICSGALHAASVIYYGSACDHVYLWHIRYWPFFKGKGRFVSENLMSFGDKLIERGGHISRKYVHIFCSDQLEIGVRGEICIFASQNTWNLNLAIRLRPNRTKKRVNFSVCNTIVVPLVSLCSTCQREKV